MKTLLTLFPYCYLLTGEATGIRRYVFIFFGIALCLNSVPSSDSFIGHHFYQLMFFDRDGDERGNNYLSKSHL